MKKIDQVAGIANAFVLFAKSAAEMVPHVLLSPRTFVDEVIVIAASLAIARRMDGQVKKNFMETTFVGGRFGKNERMTVTFQRLEGKTPAELLTEEEAKVGISVQLIESLRYERNVAFGRCREATQAIVAAIGSVGPESLEGAVARVIGKLDAAKARVAELEAAAEVRAKAATEWGEMAVKVEDGSVVVGGLVCRAFQQDHLHMVANTLRAALVASLPRVGLADDQRVVTVRVIDKDNAATWPAQGLLFNYFARGGGLHCSRWTLNDWNSAQHWHGVSYINPSELDPARPGIRGVSV